jgi:toxin ParE1/3/4
MRRCIIRHDEAERDLRLIYARIRRDRPQTAKRFLQAAAKAFRKLLRFPDLGVSLGISNPELKGLRVSPINSFENFVIFYRTLVDGIEIVHVLHGARDIETVFHE